MQFISPRNEYPRHYGDIQIENPSWVLGDPLPQGWHEVESTKPPVAGANEVVFETQPVLVDGKYKQQWSVRDLTPEEIERINAPQTAKAKLIALGLTEAEIRAITRL